MKLNRVLTLVPVFVVLFSFAYIAYGGVSGSKHDLTPVPNPSGFSVCVYCHTPHNGNTNLPGAPLWNKTVADTSNFTMYSSPTLSNAPTAIPSDISLACLSCHDATIGQPSAVNLVDPHNMIRAPGGDINNVNCVKCHVGPPFGSSSVPQSPNGSGVALSFMVGKDLSNDHPISMAYPTAIQNPQLVQPTNGKVDVLPLFNVGGSLKVECASCHDPHSTVNSYFLRKPNGTGSDICVTCHLK